MIEAIIIVLMVLWLLGAFGSRRIGGNLIHTLLVIALILIVLSLLGII